MIARAYLFKALSLGWLVLTSSGCDRILGEAARAVVQPVAKPTITAPSDAAAQRFAEAVGQAAARGDGEAVNALIDWDTFARRGAAGLPVGSASLEDVAKGAAEGCTRSGVCLSLASVGSGAAKLRYLGTHEVDGERWSTFRLMPRDGGFEHIGFALSADGTGEASAVDIKMLTGSETSASALRRVLLPLASSDPEHVAQRLTGREASFIEHGPALIRAQNLVVQGNAREALATIDALPAELRRDPTVLTQRVTYARLTGDDAIYLAAIDELAQHHPTLGPTLMAQIDGYAMRGRTKDAIAAVERAAQITKPADPYFDVVRANLLVKDKAPREAISAAKRAIAKEPDLIDAYWPWIQATLEQADFPETTRALLALSAQQVELDLTQDAVYAPYVASAEYAKLQAALRAPASP